MTTDLPEEVRKVARDAAVERWLTGSADTTQMLLSVDAALLAALPHLRQAGRKEAGEEIASALEALQDPDADSRGLHFGLRMGATTARRIGSQPSPDAEEAT